MINSVTVANHRGDVLFTRNTRGPVTQNIGEVFRNSVVLNSGESKTPIMTINSLTYCHIKEGDIYLVATTDCNSDILVIFAFLLKFSHVLQCYLPKFDQKHISSKLYLIHEILDEMLDYGHPQTTDLETLQNFITQSKVDHIISDQISESLLNLVGTKAGTKKITSISSVTEVATGSTPWRQPGITYKKNEIWIDIFENINLIVSHQGTVLRSDVEGSLQVTCQLGGMPQLTLGLNDKVQIDNQIASGKSFTGAGINLDDFTFHQCVRLSRFESDRVISFVPPDGAFTLMKYRSTQRITLPFRILSHVKQITSTKLDYEVSIISEFESTFSGHKVAIKIPTPPNTAVCKISVKGLGSAKHKPEQGAILWNIKSFAGQIEVTLRASVELIPSTKAWDRPPISMEFQVPNFTASGIKITNLDISEKSGYTPTKWNRVVTQNGSYERRI